MTRARMRHVSRYRRPARLWFVTALAWMAMGAMLAMWMR